MSTSTSTMTEAELHDVVTNCASEVSILSRLVRTALHYLARVRELEERLDRPGNLGEALGWLDGEPLAAAAQRVRAERDSARRERDDAQARVRELEAMTSTATIRDVHKALGAAPGESVVTKAEVVVAAAKAYGMVIDDARAILGAREDEMLSDAARRVVDAGPHKTVLDEARKAMGLEVGEPDPMHPIPVHHTYAGDSTEVVIRITSRDPALLSLPFGARLAVVRLP
jgi:hypothetical protein